MLLRIIKSSIALVPVVNAAKVINDTKEKGETQLTRFSDLPLYDTPEIEDQQANDSMKKEAGYLRTMLQPPVSLVREQVQAVLSQTEAVKTTIQDNYHEFQDRSDWIVKYLREEENKEIRYGAVCMGGLTGFIFGLRGGIIRRVLYAGLATTVSGFVCFPEETTELVNSNKAYAKHYVNIAYNFLYGVKPGDPQLEVKFPQLTLPKDFSEFFQLLKCLAKSTQQAIMPPPSKETDAQLSNKSK